jgi:seryl-tRNA(Sec) selenium transferase
MGDTTSHMGDGANNSVVSGADRQASLLKQAEMGEQQEKIFSTIPEVEGEPDEAT